MIAREDPGFAVLLDAAPDAIVMVDANGCIALASAQAERLFGYTRDEMVGRPLELLVPERARKVHPSRRAAYFADPHPRPMGAGMELAGRRKDGTEFPAEISLSAIETDEGLLVSAAIRDVTERRQAAAAQARLAAIIRSSHDAIIGKTLDGTVTSWNPGAERLFGWTEEEMVGRKVDVLLPPERRHEERTMLERIGRGERVEQYETERIAKDGTSTVVALTLSPITDGSGKIVGAAAVCRDIGERRRAEAQFRALLEAAPDAMVCVHRHGRIALVNAQAERLFGYSREEMVGQEVEMLVPEHARAVHPSRRARYFPNPQPRPMGAGMELAGRRKDGTEFPAEISLSAIETDEGVLVTATVRDVSDRLEVQAERERLKAQAERERTQAQAERERRKSQAERERLERQLHQSQRLESLGQLAGGVAHDFNNLLGVIVNYTAFVVEEIAKPDGGDREAVRQDLDQVRRAADRATELTHQLLAFGRREVVRPRVLDLNEVVRDVEQFLRRTLGEDVELVTSLAPDLHAVMADPGQLEQVLVNLAVNARDAMPGGGRLTIETDNVVIDADYAELRPGLEPGEHVRLRVSDTGAGMSPEVIERVFEPFFTTKPKGEGSGLGLATVYGIVAQAGGHARFHSEPGLGTTFTALLPVTRETPTTVPHSTGATAVGGGETVLLVEDEDALREVTRRILARNGYQVLDAARGSKAVDLATNHPGPIHLLVTDVVMPEMLGREVATRVVAARPGIRVLYISGYAHPVLASKGTLEEGLALLEKPFTEPVLLAKVREVLDTPSSDTPGGQS